MTDYSELKRLAEAASPGPWSTENNELYWLEDGYTKHLMETFDGSDICHDAQHPANLKFIAAANPAAVLALIAENERIEMVSRLSRNHDGYMAVLAERDQLKAEVEALRKALTYIRDTTDDWHVCEKAGSALIESGREAGQ